MTGNNPFELFDSEALRDRVLAAVNDRPVVPLNTLTLFDGAGIYAIYYTGEHHLYDPYEPLAIKNRNNQFIVPIYVGKAEHPGVRKGKTSKGGTKRPLYSRLSQHKNSILAATTTLDIRDFYCRYLVVGDRSIRTSETLLIEQTQPLWNVYVDGFGNHDPGKGRRAGQRPQWDTIHPGRTWATELPPNELSVDAIRTNIRLALAGGPAEKLAVDEQVAESDSDEL